MTSSSTTPTDSVSIQALDLSNIAGPGGNVLIGTVTVREDSVGTTELRITHYNVDDEAGDEVPAELAVRTVAVSNVLPIVPGAIYPPEVLNGDG